MSRGNLTKKRAQKRSSQGFSILGMLEKCQTTEWQKYKQNRNVPDETDDEEDHEIKRGKDTDVNQVFDV